MEAVIKTPQDDLLFYWERGGGVATVEDQHLCVVVQKYIYVYFTIMAPVE